MKHKIVLKNISDYQRFLDWLQFHKVKYVTDDGTDVCIEGEDGPLNLVFYENQIHCIVNYVDFHKISLSIEYHYNQGEPFFYILICINNNGIANCVFRIQE